MNLEIRDFEVLSDFECCEIIGGGSKELWAFLCMIGGAFVTIDDHWDQWKEDFKTGWDSYPY